MMPFPKVATYKKLSDEIASHFGRAVARAKNWSEISSQDAPWSSERHKLEGVPSGSSGSRGVTLADSA